MIHVLLNPASCSYLCRMRLADFALKAKCKSTFIPLNFYLQLKGEPAGLCSSAVSCSVFQMTPVQQTERESFSVIHPKKKKTLLGFVTPTSLKSFSNFQKCALLHNCDGIFTCRPLVDSRMPSANRQRETN